MYIVYSRSSTSTRTDVFFEKPGKFTILKLYRRKQIKLPSKFVFLLKAPPALMFHVCVCSCCCFCCASVVYLCVSGRGCSDEERQEHSHQECVRCQSRSKWVPNIYVPMGVQRSDPVLKCVRRGSVLFFRSHLQLVRNTPRSCNSTAAVFFFFFLVIVVADIGIIVISSRDRPNEGDLSCTLGNSTSTLKYWVVL